MAYENDLPFSVRLPKANLQTEGFTINDNPRNFVAETFTRVAPPAPAEEEKEEEPSETTDAKSGKRRFKRGKRKRQNYTFQIPPVLIHVGGL